MYFEFNGV